MTAAGIVGLVLCAVGFYGAWADYKRVGEKWREGRTANAKTRPPKPTPSPLASYAALQRAQLDERAAASDRLDALLAQVGKQER
jgi:hypothetical protein